MEEKQNSVILIRADGNETLGMGHLMRCLSIAAALVKAGEKCVFLTAQNPAADFVREKGFACEVLGTDYQHMESELPRLEEVYQTYSPKCWLVDSYQVTQKYLSELQKAAPVFYLDDTGEEVYEADGLINYNIYAFGLDYKERCPESMRLFLGSGYAPVRTEFLSVPYQVRKDVRNVLITMGGSDKLNIAGELCLCLAKCLPKEVSLTVICGRFNSHLEELMELQQRESRIRILMDVSDMWNRMAEADIAVSAAGSTMYELSVMGVPAVVCYYAENQRRVAEGFASQTGMTNAGDYSKDSKAALDEMIEAVCKLVKSQEERERLSARMKQIVDGQGTERIARELMGI